MKKSLAVFAAIFASSVLFVSPVFAEENEINVIVDGKIIDFENQKPIIENERVLVPFRAVLNEMGAEVDWDSQTKTVTCKKGDITVKLAVGSDEIEVNDKTIKLDVPAKIIDGTTMVPLRAVSESFNASVNFDTGQDSESKNVNIDTESPNHKSIKMETITDSVKADDGAVVLNISLDYPVLSGLGEGENIINDYYKQHIKDKLSDVIEKIGNAALSDYEKNNSYGAFYIWDYKSTCFTHYSDENYICIAEEGILEDNFNDYVYDEGSYFTHKNTSIFDLTSGKEISFKEYAGDDFNIIMKLAEEGIKSVIKEDYDHINPDDISIENASVYFTAFGYTFYFQYDYLPPVEGSLFQYTVAKGEVEKAKEENNNFENILKDDSLNFGIKKYTDNMVSNDNTVLCYTEAEYPVFKVKSNFTDKINKEYFAYIEDLSADFIDNYSKDAQDYYDEYKPEDFEAWYQNIDGTVTYIDDDKVCIVTAVVGYAGGAHPWHSKEAVIYDFNTGEKLSLGDIFENKEEILKKAEDGFREMIKNNPEEYFEDALENLDLNNAAYYITDKGITFHFDEYILAPYARGYVEYDIEL